MKFISGGKKERGARKKKTVRFRLVILVILIFVAVGGLIFVRRQILGAARGVAEVQTMALQKTDLTNGISVSGVVKSADTTNIYSNLNYPVKEIYVDVGDTVRAGEVLAVLDMSNLDKDIEQANLNFENALESSQESKRTAANSVTNAQTSLESSQISLERQRLNAESAEKDLQDAQEELGEEFDSYSYDLAIDDAKLNLDRKIIDLQEAEADYHEALHDFDDYTYQLAIDDAAIAIDRRKADLNKANSDLTAAQNITVSSTAAQDAAVDAARAVYDAALLALNSDPTDQAKIDALETALNEWQAAVAAQSAARATSQSARDEKVKAAQAAVTSAQNALEDAERNYDKAVENLKRAQTDAAKTAGDAYTRAENSAADAQRAYEKALSDKERAIEDYIEKNQTSLENAQKTAADSKKALEAAQNSLKAAQNSLNQAREKTDISDINIQLQELNLERLNEQLAEGKIIALTSGVITEIGAKEGTNPSGVLFVIEDLGDLYVSANVKEYNLLSIAHGQEVVVTTDATGDRIYNANLSFISPKAVSEAGSTSVEFEIHADIKNPDTKIKIGMNAFLNIIIEKKSNVYAVPLSVIMTSEDGRSYVCALESGEVRDIPVEIGLQTSASVEISGESLSDGMQLLTDPANKTTQGQQGTGAFMMGRR